MPIPSRIASTAGLVPSRAVRQDNKKRSARGILRDLPVLTPVGLRRARDWDPETASEWRDRDGIKRAVREGEIADIADLEMDICHYLPCCVLPSEIQLPGLDIDAHRFVRGNRLCQADCDTARSASAVQQAHAWA